MRHRLRAAAVTVVLLCPVPVAAGCGDAGTGTSSTAAPAGSNGTLSKGTLDTDNPAPPATESPGATVGETSPDTSTGAESTGAESTGAAESSAPGSTGAAAVPDPCDLLPRSEVTRLTGMSIDTVDGTTDTPELRTCGWHLVAEPGDGADFSVALSPTTPERFAEQRIDGSSDVSGVGDEAIAYQFRLYVRTGSTMINIYFRRSGVDDAAMLATLKKVGAAVVDKLADQN